MSSARASVDEALIVAYLQGALPDEARAALEERLADDSEARRVVAALASLSIFSSTMPAGGVRDGSSTAPEGAGSASLPAPDAGELLADKYRVLGALGHGAMGIVLEVEHVLLRERYALKLLRKATAADPMAVQRLVREARAAMRIDSPHVARVFDLGVLLDGRLFLVMELLAGRDLKSILGERGALPVETAVSWIEQAARGVRAAHTAAVVHRDLKPANLFVVGEGDGACVKVVDFGLSKAPEVHRRASDDAALTTSGSMIGSPMYMAPEQIRDAKTADARGDVWALGVVLYEMLAGKPPFSATTVSGVLASIMVDPVPTLAMHEVPPSLERIVLDCLEKKPEKRIASAEALLERLARWRAESAATPETSVAGTVVPLPARARARRWPLLAAGAAIVAGGAVALAMADAGPPLLTARAAMEAPRLAASPASPASLASPASGDAAGVPQELPPGAPAAALAPATATPVAEGRAAPTVQPASTAAPGAGPPRVRPGSARPPASSAAPGEVVFGKETDQRQ